jgi:hypothetical protein
VVDTVSERTSVPGVRTLLKGLQRICCGGDVAITELALPQVIKIESSQ